MQKVSRSASRHVLGVIAGVLIAGNALQVAVLLLRGRTGLDGHTATQRPSLLTRASRLPPEAPSEARRRGLWPGLVSPDGRWELNWTMDPQWATVVVARDDSRFIARRQPDREFWALASNKIWTPDSRSWVGLLAGERSLYVVVQSLDAVGPVRKVSIGYPKWTAMGFDLMSSDLLGFTDADRVLARPTGADGWPRQGTARKVPFFEFDVHSDHSSVREFTIALPEGTDTGEVVLSPTGDRLAWVLYEGSRGDPKAVQLAVCQTDGREMRVIGTLLREPWDETHQHRRLAWLPDGAHVSFSHGGSRWSVPVAP
jgi:hypothetical protein